MKQNQATRVLENSANESQEIDSSAFISGFYLVMLRRGKRDRSKRRLESRYKNLVGVILGKKRLKDPSILSTKSAFFQLSKDRRRERFNNLFSWLQNGLIPLHQCILLHALFFF